MFPNNSYFSENLDFIDNSYFNEAPYYFTSIEPSTDVSSDIYNLSEFEGIEPLQVYQLFDQAFQNYTKEIIKCMPNTLESIFPYDANKVQGKPRSKFEYTEKIGTISIEERRIKVQKFLEKRKRRVYTKKISYLCRKRVADQRERVKGRFVSKKVENVVAAGKAADEVKDI